MSPTYLPTRYVHVTSCAIILYTYIAFSTLLDPINQLVRKGDAQEEKRDVTGDDSQHTKCILSKSLP